MTRLHEVIDVPRPLDEVFRYTSNFANIEQWDPGVIESNKLTRGPVAEGSAFNVVVKSGPGRTAMHYSIVLFEPPHRVVLEGRGGSIHAIDEIRFSESGDGTRIDYTADITLGGLGGLVQPLMGGILKRVGKNALQGLHKALMQAQEHPAESFTRDLADRLVLPGALGFTRWGYASKKKHWTAMTQSLADRTALVTGATSGLGRVVAGELAEMQARVILVGRSQEKLERASREIIEASGNPRISCERADLSLMADVRSLAQRIIDSNQPLHILVNNAAVLPLERTLTPEGLETAFATDLLSPFLLTEKLLPLLKASAPARIINVSSGGMYFSGPGVDDLQNTSGEYDGSKAYAKAKRGLMVLTELWSGELQGTGVVVNAMHPGWADTPGVQDSLPGFHKLMKNVLRTPEQGADTIIWLAAAPEAGQVSGKFWLDREPHLAAVLPGTAGDAGQRKELVEELKRLSSQDE